MSKELLFNEQVLIQLNEGAKIVAKAIKPTMGPRGGFVAIDEPGRFVYLTKNGSTIAREIQLEDHCQNLGADFLKLAGNKTSINTGDGTTATILLTHTLFQESIKYIVAGININDFLYGVKTGINAIKEYLFNHSIPVSDQIHIEQLSRIAAGDELKLGNLISAAFSLDRNIYINIEDSPGTDIELSVSNGFTIKSELASSYFLSDKNELILEGCYVFITEIEISDLQSILPILNKAADEKKSLLLLAPGFSQEIITLLVNNKNNGALEAIAIKVSLSENYKELLDDISLITNGNVVGGSNGHVLNHSALNSLGIASKIKCTKEMTLINLPTDKNDLISKQIKNLNSQISHLTNNDESLIKRIQNLKGKIVSLSIGGKTPAEAFERKNLATKVIKAIQAGIGKGFVPGGGAAFVHGLNFININQHLLTGEKAGIQAFRKALLVSFKTLLENDGINPNPFIEEIQNLPFQYGYNLETGKIENLIKAGIIDAVKILEEQLDNSYSVVSKLLSTQCAIYERSENKVFYPQ